MKQRVNGVSKEVRLCGDCAVGVGMPTLSFGSLADFMMPHSPTKTLRTAKTCDLCAATFDDIIKSGKLGCGKCYAVFAAELRETLRRIHGDVGYVGSDVALSAKVRPATHTTEQLKARLDVAIAAEDYEQAASLRDQIRDLENSTSTE
ncbi:MAG: UvrB/UvrC motif-containing protein [Oscillospiraceae bacterium]|nr:UvrB/UvrC motif-containing protein [Oscillospiraceae bacterium]